MNAWVINQNKAFSGWRLEVAVVVTALVAAAEIRVTDNYWAVVTRYGISK